METRQELMAALKIHGMLSAESESDSDGCEEFDDIYRKFKPPPLDEEVIRRNLVVIHPPVVENVWAKRLEVYSKKVENLKIEDPDFPSISSPVSSIGDNSKSELNINEPGPSSSQTSTSKSNTKELESKTHSMSEKPVGKGQCSMSGTELEDSKLNQSSSMLESGGVSKKKKKGKKNKNKRKGTYGDVTTADTLHQGNGPIEDINSALQEPESGIVSLDNSPPDIKASNDPQRKVETSNQKEISDRMQLHTSDTVNETYQNTEMNESNGKKETKSEPYPNEIPQQQPNSNKTENSESEMSGKRKKKLKFVPFDLSTETPTFEVSQTQPKSLNKNNADKYSDYSIHIPLENQTKLLKGCVSETPHILKNEVTSPKSNEGGDEKITKVESIPRTDGTSMTSKADTSHASKGASKKKKSKNLIPTKIQIVDKGTEGKKKVDQSESDLSKIHELKDTIPKSNSGSRETPKSLEPVVSHNSSKRKKKKNKNTRLLELKASGISRTTETGKSSELSLISGAGKGSEKEKVLCLGKKANKTDNKNDHHGQREAVVESLRVVPNAQIMRRVCHILRGRKQADSTNFSTFSENIKAHEVGMYRKRELLNEKNILKGVIQFDIINNIGLTINCYLPVEIIPTRVENETNFAFSSNTIECNDLVQLKYGKNLTTSKSQLFNLDLEHWKNMRYGLERYLPSYDNIFNKFNIFIEFDTFTEISNYLNYHFITELDMSYVTGHISVLAQTYHDNFLWNDGTYSSKMLSKEFEDAKIVCVSNHFVQNESTKETSDQSKTSTDSDRERSLQLTITKDESNSVLVSRMNNQIILKTDLQENSYINKKWTGSQSKSTLSCPGNIRVNQKPFRHRSEGLKVPCFLTMIVHLIFTFICLYLIMSFMFWVIDNHLPITFLMMYLYFFFFNSDD